MLTLLYFTTFAFLLSVLHLFKYLPCESIHYCMCAKFISFHVLRFHVQNFEAYSLCNSKIIQKLRMLCAVIIRQVMIIYMH